MIHNPNPINYHTNFFSKSGKIAQELEYVGHNVRTKLDEIKRTEIERLRYLATREYELENSIDRNHLKMPEHLDHANQHTFEIEDLRKLILKTSSDLAEADRQRREEFKHYEMQKESLLIFFLIVFLVIVIWFLLFVGVRETGKNS